MAVRIHIIGGPGSGKTFAARQLSRRFGVPAYDLDDLFWNSSVQSYGLRASEAGREAKLTAILQQPDWIVEGVYYSWLRPSFERAQIIFALRPNVLLRDYRILKRFVGRKLWMVSTKREGVLDLLRLLSWNHRYDADNLAPAIAFIDGLQREVVTVESPSEILDQADAISSIDQAEVK
ncbi:MAG: DNA topology modulation protein FlaR [Acidobacteria bacterium]|nr:DNA topology modulation protein FlaR [Acidobacteriota bacterium]